MVDGKTSSIECAAGACHKVKSYELSKQATKLATQPSDVSILEIDKGVVQGLQARMGKKACCGSTDYD